MPLLYSQIPLYTSGMISSESFTLPRDGRRVQFLLGGENDFRKKIFVLIDGEFDSFANCSRMETPVSILDSLIPTPHEAYAIVVDTGEYRLPEVSVPITPVPVTFIHGKKAVIKFSAKIRASISARNPESLARDYVQGVVTSPQDIAAATLKTEFFKALTDRLPEMMYDESPEQTMGRVDSLSLSLASIVTDMTERKLHWCRINTCEVSLVIENVDMLIEEANTIYNLNIETKRKLLDSIISTFGMSPLPAEIATVIEKYAVSNPGLPAEDFTKFCQGVKSIWSRSTPADILSAAKQIGLISSSGGQ
ncbi:MAG: hypothetical protein J6V50_06165 [Clostridia bacterium]|nr:hypothetical protein [Clostridia bacterium]